jgi:hypothetical protein
MVLGSLHHSSNNTPLLAAKSRLDAPLVNKSVEIECSIVRPMADMQDKPKQRCVVTLDDMQRVTEAKT